VGRADELSRLEAGLTLALSGQTAAFLLAGEAGVGKTRLVTEFAARASRRGAVALTGGCLDVAEGQLPFGPFAEALRGYVRTLDADTRAALGAGELAGLVPELRLTGETSMTGALMQGQLFGLLLGLIGRLATATPLVLIVEDLHWADRSTRDLLLFLIRNLRSERVLLVATYRADELPRGHPMRRYIAELQRTRSFERLDLRPFNRAEVAEMVAGIVGPAADRMLVDSVFARSAGNPFFAEELVAAGGGDGQIPTTLREILLARVDRLSPAARELLSVIAVAGREVSDQLLAAASVMPEDVRLPALREAVTHHLLKIASQGYAFRHELAREVVYRELLPGERVRLHGAYGRALSDRPELEPDSGVLASELARHWLAAGNLPGALSAAVDAGRVSQKRSGFAEAQRHYERALELWDQVPAADRRAGLTWTELLRQAADMASLAGEHGRAAALIRQAIDQLDPRLAAAAAGVLWERLGRFLWASGDSETALQAYEQAITLVPADPPSPARARVLAARGQALMLLARHADSRQCCTEAVAIARLTGARAEEGHALNTLGCDLAYLGEDVTAVRHLRDALRIAEEVGDLDDLFRAYLNLSDLLAGPLNRLEEGLALALEGAERSGRTGMAGDYGVSLRANAATALIELGRLAEADEILAAAQLHDGSEMAAIDLHQCRARLYLCQGRFGDAAAHVRSTRELMVKTVDPPYHAPLYAIEAELSLWQGQPAAASQAAAQGLALVEGTDVPWLAAPLLWLACRAEADLAGGVPGRDKAQRRAGAEGRSAQLLAHARALRDSTDFVPAATRAYLELCEAEAARLAGPGAAANWHSSAGTWASLERALLEAYAHWRHADALLADRRAREGAAALARAHALASRAAAMPLLQEVEALARRARVGLVPVPMPAPAPAPAAGTGDRPGGADLIRLTARQFQVLALIEAGMTNREIAQRLFITEKTAGSHVSNILAVLGVRSRVEAATAAHRLGLV
jgi:DNA-binding CsgD family transcriptional regulator/tetratricopeptide (TPR) repeat protein